MYFMTFARHSGEAGTGVCGCLAWLLLSRSMLSGPERSPLSVSYLSVLLGATFLVAWSCMSVSNTWPGTYSADNLRNW